MHLVTPESQVATASNFCVRIGGKLVATTAESVSTREDKPHELNYVYYYVDGPLSAVERLLQHPMKASNKDW